MEQKNTRVVKVDPENMDISIIQEAADIIRNGGLVVFPTETVYGLGADAFNETACGNIFEAKGRPHDNPLIVHISDIKELSNVVKEVPESACKLANEFWPGPLTMIMKKSEKTNYEVTAGLDTVAVRMPNNKIARELIRLSGTPIAAPSANTSGKPSPTIAEHVIDDMYGRVDMIIDGGSASIGLESTVLDITVDIPTILRPGEVSREDVECVLGSCDYDPAIIKSDDKLIPKSPGQKYRHYHPDAKVITYDGFYKNAVKHINTDCQLYLKQGLRVGILATEQTKELYKGGIVKCIGDRVYPDTIAANLFRELREFDKLGVDLILSESFEEGHIGRAIMNRLGKASSEIKAVDNLKLLFVCTGNTCRSCMAEGIAKNIIMKSNLNIDVSSAGIDVLCGENSSENAITALNEIGLDISRHKAQQLTKAMIDSCDMIFTMTEYQKQVLLRTNKGLFDKIYTLKEYCNNKDFDISDPYGMSIEKYRQVRDELIRNINTLINKIYY